MRHRYVLTPHEQPPWRFDPDDFAVRIRRRWPRARIGDLHESPMQLHALIPADPRSRDLGVALARGWTVVLEPATPAGAGEFALWYVSQLPAFDPRVYLIADNSAAGPLALRRDTTAEELLTLLAPPDVTRPDPRAAGSRAADILHLIHDSPHYPHLIDATRMLPHRWATLTGSMLVATLDLANDAEPLLHEALRLLALRAAVYELTGSTTTAATLVAAAPVDDAVRAMLAEYLLCTQMAQSADIRLVHQTSEWTPLGWQTGNYTHQCYRSAWEEPNPRYWLDAGEVTRRLQTVNRLCASIGVNRDGRQHNIRFERLPDPSMVAI